MSVMRCCPNLRVVSSNNNKEYRLTQRAKITSRVKVCKNLRQINENLILNKFQAMKQVEINVGFSNMLERKYLDQVKLN